MRRMNDERGAIAVMVAVMMAVFFGAATIVIDPGAMYWERRELQNGADAAALAVARDCATSVFTCVAGTAAGPGSAEYLLASDYAEGNANDGEANIGHPDRPGCGSSSNGVSQEGVCFGAGEVTVTTSTRDSAGNSSLSHFFAPVLSRLVGAPPRDATRVGAAATAAWGYVSSVATVPLVISACDYDSGTAYQPPYPSASEETLMFHDGTSPTPSRCPVGPAGMDADGDGFLPSGFGWLETDPSCNVVTTTVDGEDWVTKNPGNDAACDAATLFASFTPGTVVAIPVFDDFCRPSQTPPPACPNYNNKDKYHIARYAAFYISGYRLGGPAFRKVDNVYRTAVPCASSQRCITGWFTTMTVDEGELGGPEGGVLVVRLRR